MWELKQRKLVDMAADRGAFIDQSQSFNVHMSDPNFGKLTSLHFHAWKVQSLTLDLQSSHFHNAYLLNRSIRRVKALALRAPYCDGCCLVCLAL